MAFAHRHFAAAVQGQGFRRRNAACLGNLVAQIKQICLLLCLLGVQPTGKLGLLSVKSAGQVGCGVNDFLLKGLPGWKILKKKQYLGNVQSACRWENLRKPGQHCDAWGRGGGGKIDLECSALGPQQHNLSKC